MKKLAFVVQCYQDRHHEIPLVVRVEDYDKPDAPRTLEVQCPICKSWNSVDVGQPLAPNETMYRGIKKA